MLRSCFSATIFLWLDSSCEIMLLLITHSYYTLCCWSPHSSSAMPFVAGQKLRTLSCTSGPLLPRDSVTECTAVVLKSSTDVGKLDAGACWGWVGRGSFRVGRDECRRQGGEGRRWILAAMICTRIVSPFSQAAPLLLPLGLCQCKTDETHRQLLSTIGGEHLLVAEFT